MSTGFSYFSACKVVKFAQQIVIHSKLITDHSNVMCVKRIKIVSFQKHAICIVGGTNIY